jgi:hypothetical protein
MLNCGSAANEISEEEGNYSLIPSSEMRAVAWAVVVERAKADCLWRCVLVFSESHQSLANDCWTLAWVDGQKWW